MLVSTGRLGVVSDGSLDVSSGRLDSVSTGELSTFDEDGRSVGLGTAVAGPNCSIRYCWTSEGSSRNQSGFLSSRN